MPVWLLGSSVITAVTHSSPDASTFRRSHAEEAKHLYWCDKLRSSKSPEKAFSSSWVTRVQLAPSRLINPSNEPWIFNTYRRNGASTLAVLFHIWRTLQIIQQWFKHWIFFSLSSEQTLILECLWAALKPDKASFSPSDSRLTVLSDSHLPPLSQRFASNWNPFFSRISILWIWSDLPRHFL